MGFKDTAQTFQQEGNPLRCILDKIAPKLSRDEREAIARAAGSENGQRILAAAMLNENLELRTSSKVSR